MGTAKTGAVAPTPQTAFFPLSAVHRGLHGTAYTVFEGTQPEAMDVEILGVLHNAIGPGKDMVLARLTGSRPEFTGVVAGMSGSPVYIDGKLLGAISFRIGQLPKEPIAGITPIGQMMDMVRQSGAAGASSIFPARVPIEAPSFAAAGTSEKSQNGQNVFDATSWVRPIETPLVFDGYSPQAVQFFKEQFHSWDMTAVSALGSASPDQKQSAPIVPGSAISALIVSGDLNISATCTVTYVDANNLLACGHPITHFGRVSLPMTKAEVVATVASQLDPIKIINTTETVGAFTDDRSSGILGHFGAKAPMIPVTVEMHGFPQPRTYHFSVVENPRLTPGAVTVSIYQTLQGTNGYNDQSSYRIHGLFRFEDRPPVALDTLISPDDHTMPDMAVAQAISQRFAWIYSNPEQRPHLQSITVRVDAVPGRQTATLVDAHVVDLMARPGAMVTVEATIQPYRGKQRVVRLPVRLPETLEAGTARLLVSDGGLLDRIQSLVPGPTTPPENLDVLIGKLDRMHANDKVYVTLLSSEPQATVDGVSLPAVPLSMANVLQPNGNGPGASLHGETAVPLGSASVDAVLQGARVLEITVRP